MDSSKIAASMRPSFDIRARPQCVDNLDHQREPEMRDSFRPPRQCNSAAEFGARPLASPIHNLIFINLSQVLGAHDLVPISWPLEQNLRAECEPEHIENGSTQSVHKDV
jgi:hypothetical protein